MSQGFIHKMSGYSGYSGKSGYSGASGSTSTSGYSGVSGYSGASGYSGVSGYSGASGYSGYSGDITSFKLFTYGRTNASGTATTVEEVFASALIPGGTLGSNDTVEVITQWEFASTSTSNKLTIVRLHTSAAVGGTIMTQIQSAFSGATSSIMGFTRIAAKNSTTSQVGGLYGATTGGFGLVTNPTTPSTAAIDTSSDAYVVICGKKASSADTLVLHNYDIRINKA